MSVTISDKAKLANFADSKHLQKKSYDIDGKRYKLIRYYSNPYNGYQGYAYKFTEYVDKNGKSIQVDDEDIGKIYVVHAGSNDLSTPKNVFTKESFKDWVKTDSQLVLNKIPSQYYSAEYFLNYVREKHNKNSNANMEQIGQSLGGTLANMLGMLKINSDIPVYSSNTLGAAAMENKLGMAGYEVSHDYSNINNYFYTNEIVSKIKSQVGNIYVADFIEKNLRLFII